MRSGKKEGPGSMGAWHMRMKGAGRWQDPDTVATGRAAWRSHVMRLAVAR
jgi:hypothetical protein